MTRTESPADLDTAALGRWLDTQDAPGAGEEPVAEVLKGGSQNMLYRINRGGEGMVLRFSGNGKVVVCSRSRAAFVSWLSSAKPQ